jgi:hypothetical protein
MQIDTEGKLKDITASALVGKMVAVLGITGSGKTNTAAVLIEELLAARYPMTIVDIEGEYYGLKERFEVLVAGQSQNVDVQMSQPEQASQLARLSVERGIAVVLDVSEFDSEEERFSFLLAYFITLWDANFKSRKPYAIFLEEAHEYVPQGARTPLKAVLTRLALRGRKRGFGVILMSQRSAKVDKDVLTQASVSFLHRVQHPTDVGVYKELIPLPAREVEAMVAGLGQGQAIVLNGNQPVEVAQIRLRQTLHVGATPEFGEGSGLDFQPKKIDAGLLSELQKLAAVNEVEPVAEAKGRAVPSREREQAAQIKKLEAELAQARLRVVELEERVKALVTPGTQEIIPAPVTQVGPVLPGELEISKLKVREAEIAQVVRKVTTTQTHQTEERVEVARGKTTDVVLLKPYQQKRLDNIVSKLKTLSKLERAILAVLVDEPNRIFSFSELVSCTNYSPGSVRPSWISGLFKTGLATYSENKYRANVVQYARKALPEVDTKIILDRIKQNLS